MADQDKKKDLRPYTYKRPKYPHYMKRNWWQTVTTPHTGLRVSMETPLKPASQLMRSFQQPDFFLLSHLGHFLILFTVEPSNLLQLGRVFIVLINISSGFYDNRKFLFWIFWYFFLVLRALLHQTSFSELSSCCSLRLLLFYFLVHFLHFIFFFFFFSFSNCNFVLRVSFSFGFREVTMVHRGGPPCWTCVGLNNITSNYVTRTTRKL